MGKCKVMKKILSVVVKSPYPYEAKCAVCKRTPTPGDQIACARNTATIEKPDCFYSTLSTSVNDAAFDVIKETSKQYVAPLDSHLFVSVEMIIVLRSCNKFRIL